jgi:hypothetical protein
VGVKKRHKWSAEEMNSAFALRRVSVKAYRYMIKKLKIPLPSLSTLRRWCSRVLCEEGILHCVLPVMTKKGK